jgi:hypothetical protein
MLAAAPQGEEPEQEAAAGAAQSTEQEADDSSEPELGAVDFMSEDEQPATAPGLAAASSRFDSSSSEDADMGAEELHEEGVDSVKSAAEQISVAAADGSARVLLGSEERHQQHGSQDAEAADEEDADEVHDDEQQVMPEEAEPAAEQPGEDTSSMPARQPAREPSSSVDEDDDQEEGTPGSSKEQAEDDGVTEGAEGSAEPSRAGPAGRQDPSVHQEGVLESKEPRMLKGAPYAAPC